MGSEYDDGVPIRRHTRESGGAAEFLSNGVGIILTLLVWFGWLVGAGGAYVAGFESVGRKAFQETHIALGIGGLIGGSGWILGAVIGAIGWAAIGNRPGVVGYRVSAVSAIVTIVIAFPVYWFLYNYGASTR